MCSLKSTVQPELSNLGMGHGSYDKNPPPRKLLQQRMSHGHAYEDVPAGKELLEMITSRTRSKLRSLPANNADLREQDGLGFKTNRAKYLLDPRRFVSRLPDHSR